MINLSIEAGNVNTYALGFAIRSSWWRQSNALDKYWGKFDSTMELLMLLDKTSLNISGFCLMTLVGMS